MIKDAIYSNIAVLIPVYNDWEGLIRSINSIKEVIAVDLVIVDDGSEIKGHLEKLNAVYDLGAVHLIVLERNMGIERALNAGLAFIENRSFYQVIARLDCGDICAPNRFEIQYKYLQKDDDLKLLGSQVNFVDLDNHSLYRSNLPLSYGSLRKKFHLNCYIIHPTVMFKRELLNEVGRYPLNYKAAEDYAFFFAILKNNKVENLDLTLVDVLVNPNGISSINRKIQVRSKLRILRDNYHFGLYPTIGIIRNLVLYFIPRNGVVFLRKWIS
jgi:hypothetical protein